MAFATDQNKLNSPENPQACAFHRPAILKKWREFSQLPLEYLDQSAKEHGAAAFQSHGRFKGGLDLLHVICLWATTSLSLRAVAAWAHGLGLAEFSAVALYKRIGRSRAWFEALLQYLFEQVATSPPVMLKNRWVVMIADATDINFADTKLKMHWAIDAATMRIQQIHYCFEQPKKGETIRNYELGENQLWLGDCAYGSASQFAVLRKHNAHGLTGYSRNMNLYESADCRGKPLDLQTLVRSVNRKQPVEHTVFINAKSGPMQVRLLIRKLSKKSAARQREQMRDKVKRRKIKNTQEARSMTDYILLITTMSEDDLSLEQALDLYRLRWQIELLFKRAKSLMDMNRMRCQKSHEHAAVWVLAHLLMQLLRELKTDRLLEEPWETMREQAYHLTQITWTQIQNLLKCSELFDDDFIRAYLAALSGRQHKKKRRSHERLTDSFNLPNKELWTNGLAA